MARRLHPGRSGSAAMPAAGCPRCPPVAHPDRDRTQRRGGRTGSPLAWGRGRLAPRDPAPRRGRRATGPRPAAAVGRSRVRLAMSGSSAESRFPRRNDAVLDLYDRWRLTFGAHITGPRHFDEGSAGWSARRRRTLVSSSYHEDHMETPRRGALVCRLRCYGFGAWVAGSHPARVLAGCRDDHQTANARRWKRWGRRCCCPTRTRGARQSSRELLADPARLTMIEGGLFSGLSRCCGWSRAGGGGGRCPRLSLTHARPQRAGSRVGGRAGRALRRDPLRDGSSGRADIRDYLLRAVAPGRSGGLFHRWPRTCLRCRRRSDQLRVPHQHRGARRSRPVCRYLRDAPPASSCAPRVAAGTHGKTTTRR